MQLYCARLQHQISFTTVCWAMCCLLGASEGIADTLPSAGSLQQNIQTGRGLNRPAMPPTSNLPPLLPKQIARGGPTLTVNQFRWVGNSFFSDQQLDRLTAASLGQTMDWRWPTNDCGVRMKRLGFSGGGPPISAAWSR